MTALTVVEDLDPLGYGGLDVSARRPRQSVKQVALDRREEAPGDGINPTVTLSLML
jgi:hypothetical protein